MSGSTFRVSGLWAKYIDSSCVAQSTLIVIRISSRLCAKSRTQGPVVEHLKICADALDVLIKVGDGNDSRIAAERALLEVTVAKPRSLGSVECVHFDCQASCIYSFPEIVRSTRLK